MVGRRKNDVVSDDDEHVSSTTDSKTSGSSEGDTNEESVVPKKGLKRRSSLTKKDTKQPSKKKSANKKGSLPSSSVNDKKQKLLNAARRDAKAEFEQMRDTVLNEIPKKYRNMFGQIGFTRWTKSTIPVLILSPFDVPPGSVRQTWMSMYEKKREKNMLNTMSYLIYWYGAISESSMFGFIAQNAFIPYDVEVAKGSKGSHFLSPKLQEKVQAGATLNTSDKEKVNAYKEMEEDLKLDPVDRKRGIFNFKEGYDLLGIDDVEDVTSFDVEGDNDEVDEMELKDDEEELSQASSAPAEKSKQKPKIKEVATKAIAKKKIKGKKVPEAEGQDVVIQDESNASSRKRRQSEHKKDGELLEDDSGQRVSKGNKRRKNKDVKEDEEDVSNTRKQAGKKATTSEHPSVAEMKIGKKRRKLDENQDENGDDKLESSNNDKRRSGRLSKDTNIDADTKTIDPTKKETKIIVEISKNVALYDKPDVDVNDEQKQFEECERKYLAKINRWKECVAENDVDGLEAILSDLVKIVDKFSAPFVQSYDIVTLIKKTEEVVPQSGLAHFKLLKSNLFLSFAKKKPLIPKNFTPILGRVEIKGLDEASTVADQDELVQVKVEPEESTEIKEGPKVKIEEGSSNTKSKKSKVEKQEKHDSVVDIKEDEEAELAFDEDDEKDADFSDEGKAASDEDRKSATGDEDLEGDEVSVKKLKRGQKDVPRKKIQATKSKVEKVMSERGKILKEHNAFKVSQRRFLPVVERWKTSLESEDIKELKNLIEEVPSMVEEFSATFIKVYGLPDLLKGTKRLFKRENEDLAAWASLREKLIICYNQKSALVPEGFTPKMIEGDASIYKLESKKEEYVSAKSDSQNESKSPLKNTEAAKNEIIAKHPSSNNVDVDTKKATLPEVKVEPKLNTTNRPSSTVIQAKPERKKFSLTSLMRPSSKEPDFASKESDPTRSVNNLASNSSSTLKPEKKPIPSWIKDPPSLEAPSDDPRFFALEFLTQMANQFPVGKVNVDSVARSLEFAIYSWATSNNKMKDESWTPKYWNKLHAIVAAVCGKRENGTLMDLLSKGQFESPEKVIGLSDDDLIASFEGRTLNL